MARKIREWALTFANTGAVPLSRHGWNAKVSSLVMHEDVRRLCLKYIRTDKETKGGVDVLQFQRHVNEIILPKKKLTAKISERTTRRWLCQLGLEYKEKQAAVYFDGHEKAAVRASRAVFGEKMLEFEKRITVYTGDDMMTELSPYLGPPMRELVAFPHDESTFWANDDVKRKWFLHNKGTGKKKDRGPSKMVSAFVCTHHGCISDAFKEFPRRLSGPDLTKRLNDRITALKESTGPRLELLVKLLHGGMRWVGSGLMVFLVHGVDRLVAVLDEQNEFGGPAHDLDMYRTTAPTTALDAKVSSKYDD